MAKPIQIAATSTRTEHQQFGVQTLWVLTDDGRIFSKDWTEGGLPGPWLGVSGPWEVTESSMEPELNFAGEGIIYGER